ncbi:hypothetical protein C8F04DRAFT_1149615 [Mycena alexandri]|uniref:DUF6699 domain-containing protein n=1 Tax=Mycena alexandri TaxID=1745969 RepID=A0AAD6S165_9AGAR|nr:hypothetical protein C8F04DRAFT_1149615 [Mycena alexandri]
MTLECYSYLARCPEYKDGNGGLCLCISRVPMAAKHLRFNNTVDVVAEVSRLAPALTPHDPECPQLDFSLPSSTFRQHTQFTLDFLNRAAHTPPLTEVDIRILSANGLSGLCAFRVRHRNQNGLYDGNTVTVGDVLTVIHRTLREHDPSTDGDVLRSCNRRISALPASAQREERALGPRRIDHLLGKVFFNGIVIPAESHRPWEVTLQDRPKTSSL